jgi:serine/threonine protein kinase
MDPAGIASDRAPRQNGSSAANNYSPQGYSSAVPGEDDLEQAKGELHVCLFARKSFSALRDLVPKDGYVAAERLRVLKVLGEGAFARVELAELAGFASRGALKVALKTLKPEILDDDVELENFAQEVQLFQKLQHRRAHVAVSGPQRVASSGAAGRRQRRGPLRAPAPRRSIVKYIGCGSSEYACKRRGATRSTFYMVQEYCQGGSLREAVMAQMCCPRKKLYCNADALRWCIDLAEALLYLHTRMPKIIHRDLKLDNVLLTDANLAVSSAKLTDFGLAKLLVAARHERTKFHDLCVRGGEGCEHAFCRRGFVLLGCRVGVRAKPRRRSSFARRAHAYMNGAINAAPPLSAAGTSWQKCLRHSGPSPCGIGPRSWCRI